MLQLAHLGHPKVSLSTVTKTLDACEKQVIDPRSGLLRPYRSAFFQRAFRSVYRLRHDPDLGDLGGVVHLLWIYHAIGRDYVAADSLFDAAVRQMHRAPFIESMPYCLDFDIVQLVRTTLPRRPEMASECAARAEQMHRDILSFLTSKIPESYTLHKLPGALATLHECSLICDGNKLSGLDLAEVDIIKKAFWI